MYIITRWMTVLCPIIWNITREIYTENWFGTCHKQTLNIIYRQYYIELIAWEPSVAQGSHKALSLICPFSL